MPILKPGLMIATAAIICALVLAGVRFAAPAIQKMDTGPAVGSAQGWTNRQLTQLDTMINGLIDRIYLHLYDRRAPAQPTPAATPTTSPKPTPGAQPVAPPKP